jgi:hypothetical protein
MNKNIDNQSLKALVDYVSEQHLDETSKNKIRSFCSVQDPLTTTVYRGHTKSQIIRPSIWYSTSKNIAVAAKEFAGGDCCVFTIHLINTPCIDVNRYIGKLIGTKAEEEEIIFLGGGKFYKNEYLTEEGFTPLGIRNGKQNFETWYSIDTSSTATANASATATSSKKQIQQYMYQDESKENQPNQTPQPNQTNKDINQLANLIDKDEYELIDTPDDIIFPRYVLTEAEKKQIFDIIQMKKQAAEMIGGKKRQRKNTKRNRKNTKRNRKNTKRNRKNSKRRRNI